MNIYDYINWRGDLPFQRDPFNNVDNLLFSYIAYVDLQEFVSKDETVTLREAAERFFRCHTEEECLSSGSFISHAPVVMRRMAETVRFGNVTLSNYVRSVSKTDTEQFSAVVYRLDARTSYVAFCGTDDTMIGWKEDFQMSYRLVNSQIHAAAYLNEIAKGVFRRYYIGGHSKGGTLAVYAAMKADSSVQKKIITVFSNDGPGLNDVSMDSQAFSLIKDRILKIIPELSIFGLLFDNHERRMIIRSTNSLFMEHDPISWQVKGTSFEEGILSNDCALIQKGFEDFLATMNKEERKAMVDEMFAVFEKAGIEKTTDFTSEGMIIFARFIRQLMNINENARHHIGAMLKIFRKLLSEKADTTIKAKVKAISDLLPDIVKKRIIKNKETSE